MTDESKIVVIHEALILAHFDDYEVRLERNGDVVNIVVEGEIVLSGSWRHDFVPLFLEGIKYWGRTL